MVKMVLIRVLTRDSAFGFERGWFAVKANRSTDLPNRSTDSWVFFAICSRVGQIGRPVYSFGRPIRGTVACLGFVQKK